MTSTENSTTAYRTPYETRIHGTEEWMGVAGDTPERAVERTLLLQTGRHPKRVRQVSPEGAYRGLIGGRTTSTVFVRPAR